MIDNFDQLVERCNAKRRRKMIRLSLMIVGTLLFAIASVAGFNLWLSGQTAHTPAETVKKETNASLSFENNGSNAVNMENNLSVAAPVPVNPMTPQTVPTPLAPKPTPPAASVASAPSPVGQMTSIQKPVVAENVPTSTPPATAAAKTGRILEVDSQPPLSPVDAYQKNPSYETALAAARTFYMQQNYVDAATWAKKANQLNREAEDAWLLYAKSYYAQGRKKEAMEVLELFLNYKDSKAASELLRTWKFTPSN